MITVVGIGFESGDITAKGKKAIRGADLTVSRGKNRMASVHFSERFRDCESYAELDEKIAEFVISESDSGKNVVFLSVGDGFGDTAVKLIAEKREIVTVPGVADVITRNQDGSFMTYSAYDVDQTSVFDSSVSTLIYQIDDKFVCGDVKLALLKFYGEDTLVKMRVGKEIREVALEDIDREKIAQGSSIFIAGEKNFMKKKRYGFSDLLAIMRALTGENGCPWDKAQTHDSICIDMLEEAYEAVDAVKRGDIDDSIEELGDLILQSVFHADIAMREGEYDIFDILTGLCYKLVSRHTHIFGENKADNPDEALFYWEKAKAKEKSYSTFSEQIDRLPDNFPAALLLEKFIKKANKNGAAVTKEMLTDKISACASKTDEESVKTLLSASVMYGALCGYDAEIAMLDKFRQLKTASGENLTTEIVEKL